MSCLGKYLLLLKRGVSRVSVTLTSIAMRCQQIGQRITLQRSHSTNPANTKHLYNICTTSAQRRRRWSNIVQMLYKCFVFAVNLYPMLNVLNGPYSTALSR